MTEPRLAPFRGGLRLDPCKDASTRGPIRRGLRPKRLVLAMRQHRGTPARAIVEPGQRVHRGQIVGAPGEPPSAAVHAPFTGVVRGLEERWIPGGSQLHRSLCVVLDTDDEDSSAVPLLATAPQDRLSWLRQGGIVGLGGAAYPAADKLYPAPPVRALILNGAECEPYISCDDLLMRESAPSILEGARVLADLVTAPAILVAIERDKPSALEAMQVAAVAAHDPRIRIVGIPSIYPAGGERQLVALLTGIEIPSGRFPSQVGYPCHNVGTALAVQRWAAGQPLLSRIVTVTGAGVAQPCNVEVPIGTSIADLIDFCGGYDVPVERLLVGGSMMGYALPSDDMPVTKSTNCIVAARADELATDTEQWPCIRCGECASACPARLLPQELWAANTEDYEALHLDACIECGCCDVVCPSRLPLTQHFRVAKQVLRRQRQLDALARDAEQRSAEKAAREAARDQQLRAQQQALKERADSDAVRAALARAKARREQTERDA